MDPPPGVIRRSTGTRRGESLQRKETTGQTGSGSYVTPAASETAGQDNRQNWEKRRRARKIPNLHSAEKPKTEPEGGKRRLLFRFLLLLLIIGAAAAAACVWRSGRALKIQADGQYFGLMAYGTDTKALTKQATEELAALYGTGAALQMELSAETAFSLGGERKTEEELIRFLSEKYLAENTCAYVLYTDGTAVAASYSEEVLREQVRRAAEKAETLIGLQEGEKLLMISEWEIAYEFCPKALLKEEEWIYALLLPVFETEERVLVHAASLSPLYAGAALPVRYRTSSETERTVRQSGGALRYGISRTVKRAEAIPYSTIYTPAGEFYKEADIPVSEGKNGVRYTVTEVLYDCTDGEDTAWHRKLSEVLLEPVAAYRLRGTSEETTTTALGRFLFPLQTEYIYTSRFGGRNLWGTENYHRGIDLVAEEGAVIYAADGGIVSYAGYLESYGNFVIINHQNGFETVYAHLESYSVAFEDPVYPGQPIGIIGDTGNTSGVHLHFEIRSFGALVDPADYLDLPPYVDYGA